MTSSPVDSAIDTLVAYFSTVALTFRNRQITLNARRGWARDQDSFDYTQGPLLTIHSVSEDHDDHMPYPVVESSADGEKTQWNVSDWEANVHLNLFAPTRKELHTAGHVVQRALHNDIPFPPGLTLTQGSHFSRLIELRIESGEDIAEGQTPQIAEWRRRWDGVLTFSEIVDQLTPRQQQWLLRTDSSDTLVTPENTTIIP